MWNPLDTIVFIVGSMIAAILIVTLLGSGLGGWLILLGLIALLALATPWHNRLERERKEREEWVEAAVEARRRHDASIRENRIREIQDRLGDGS